MTQIEAERIIDLRHRVLRALKPRESAYFEGDAEAVHFAALEGDAVVACLSMMQRPFNHETALQLRGMACAEICRGRGIGRDLLAFMEKDLLSGQDPWLIWCNAREIAVPFYKKCGWRIESDAFDIAGAGIHFQMSKRGPA